MARSGGSSDEIAFIHGVFKGSAAGSLAPRIWV